MRPFLLLALLFPLTALAKSGGTGHGGSHAAGTTQSPSASKSSGTSTHGGGMHNRLDPRNVPPMASDRKVHVQDCTKPVDWSAGNLKCK
jgi:hypothetical protein